MNVDVEAGADAGFREHHVHRANLPRSRCIEFAFHRAGLADVAAFRRWLHSEFLERLRIALGWCSDDLPGECCAHVGWSQGIAPAAQDEIRLRFIGQRDIVLARSIVLGRCPLRPIGGHRDMGVSAIHKSGPDERTPFAGAIVFQFPAGVDEPRMPPKRVGVARHNHAARVLLRVGTNAAHRTRTLHLSNKPVPCVGGDHCQKKCRVAVLRSGLSAARCWRSKNVIW